jgi:Transposase DDE domain
MGGCKCVFICVNRGMTLTYKDYCQFLLNSPFNYTQTFFADHSEGLSHDRLNRLLRTIDIGPDTLWDNVKDRIIHSPNGYLVFDDTVLDKRHSQKIEGVYCQWSGNEKRTINGIGVVTCIYVNPDVEQFWSIDYRIYDPNRDGLKKTDHVAAMSENALCEKGLSVSTVLVDSWYAKREWLEWVHAHGLTYYVPVKANRCIAEQQGVHDYRRVDTLTWDHGEREHGKSVRLNDFRHSGRLYCIEVLPGRTEYVATNNEEPLEANKVRQECGVRWKIEQFHRELKQLTGIEKCQCRKAICQQNHIGCAMLVWNCLREQAVETGRTVYALWKEQFSFLLRHLFQNPTLNFA